MSQTDPHPQPSPYSFTPFLVVLGSEVGLQVGGIDEVPPNRDEEGQQESEQVTDVSLPDRSSFFDANFESEGIGGPADPARPAGRTPHPRPGPRTPLLPRRPGGTYEQARQRCRPPPGRSGSGWAPASGRDRSSRWTSSRSGRRRFAFIWRARECARCAPVRRERPMAAGSGARGPAPRRELTWARFRTLNHVT